jgi:hypothetical protein
MLLPQSERPSFTLVVQTVRLKQTESPYPTVIVKELILRYFVSAEEVRCF